MYSMALNMNQEGFISWLDDRLKEKGWTDNQLAKHAGFSHPVISKARSGIQAIGYESCIKIAKAFDLPPAVVLEKAGLLPTTTQRSVREAEAVYLFNQLPPEKQEDFIKMIRVLIPEGGNDKDEK